MGKNCIGERAGWSLERKERNSPESSKKEKKEAQRKRKSIAKRF
jgi:hypothetical protein